MRSYWERDVLTRFDIVIVGGGILGLCTAIEARKKYPNDRIAIFEREILPHGATTRNAGFLCFGSPTELWDNYQNFGESTFLQLIEKRYQGMQKLLSILPPNKIDYENYGGYELIFHGNNIEDKVHILNQKLRDIFEKDVFEFQNEKIQTFGFEQVQSLIYNGLEGQLHSGKLIQVFHSILHTTQIQYFSNVEITSWNDYGSQVQFNSNNESFYTQKLIWTTNAIVPNQWTALENQIQPGRGQVLITHPIANLPFRGCFHFDSGYYYFRNVGDRVLLGGGRNIDFQSETTTDIALNEIIQDDLISKLHTIILPTSHFSIDMQWSGIMAFSDSHLPVISHHSPNVLYAMNCNGMGVSLSAVTAKEVVDRL